MSIKAKKQAPLESMRPLRVSSEEAIRYRAYEIFQARSSQGSPGDALSDWVQAEREMRRAGVIHGEEQLRPSR